MNLAFMGEKIKASRMEQRLTLETLSEMIGISRNFLWEIEAGRKAPAIQTLYKIGKELNISIDYLLGLSSKKTGHNDNMERSIKKEIYQVLDELNGKELDMIYKLLKTYKDSFN